MPIVDKMKNLRKIRTALPDSLRRRITDSLREAILAGEIEPGERINEAFIAEKLGVSRSPIREAIRALEAEGLVETFDRRGSFVRMINTNEVEEVYQVLSMLEVDTVKLAVLNLSVGHKRKLQSVLRRMEKVDPKTPFKKVNLLYREFHHTIAKATQNNLLIKLRLSLASQEEVFHRAYAQEKSNVVPAVSEHLAIGRAILAKDTQRAAALMRQHVHQAKERAIRALQKREAKAGDQDAA